MSERIRNHVATIKIIIYVNHFQSTLTVWFCRIVSLLGSKFFKYLFIQTSFDFINFISSICLYWLFQLWKSHKRSWVLIMGIRIIKCPIDYLPYHIYTGFNNFQCTSINIKVGDHKYYSHEISDWINYWLRYFMTQKFYE